MNEEQVTFWEFIKKHAGDGTLLHDPAYFDNNDDINTEDEIKVALYDFGGPKDLDILNIPIIDKLSSIKPLISVSNVKYPYYQLRGMPVTKAQAIDIISHTDNMFYTLQNMYNNERKKQGKSCTYKVHDALMFGNSWFGDKDKFGWCHPDGRISVNGNMSKFLFVDELIHILHYFVEQFPYLDIVIAFTKWNEASARASKFWYKEFKKNLKLHVHNEDIWNIREQMTYEDFYKGLIMGYHVHDGVIEIIDQYETYELIKMMKRLHGETDYASYKELNNRGDRVDYDFFLGCLKSIGHPLLRKYIRINSYDLIHRLQVTK